MTLEQALAFGLIGAAVILFVWGRFRYDFVALAVLLAGVLIGVVPAKDAFSGFSSDIVAIIAGALVVSHAIARSGVIEAAMRPLLRRLDVEQTQVPVLTGGVTAMSMVTKNIGALAIFMPLAAQMSKRTGTPLSRLLMPMAFASLLGGIVTLVGTSPNIIVAQMREDLLGEPFKMFDYTPVGICLALGGALFLSFAYRLLPKDRQGAASLNEALETTAYHAEAEAPEGWTMAGQTVGDVRAMAEGDVQIAAVVRGKRTFVKPRANLKVQAGDAFLLEGDPDALDRLVARAGLNLDRHDKPLAKEEPSDDLIAAEAIVARDSAVMGRTARSLNLHQQYGVILQALGRRGARLTERLRGVAIRAGDLVVLRGSAKAMPGVMKDLGLLPLAERPVALGGARRSLFPVLILAAAMVMVATEVVPVSIAFFGAAVLMIAIGAVPMREVYGALDGPVLILIPCLIPVSAAIETTGGAGLVGHWLAEALAGAPPLVALGAVMVAAMAVTPFLNNAATVLVMAPISASLARDLGMNPDPFLMAVAIGAGCDFLTPIGHQCNTLVMGPGGYRFGDYARLGAPLSLFVVLVGTPLIAVFWPLRAAAGG